MFEELMMELPGKIIRWFFGKIFSKNPKTFQEILKEDRIRNRWLSLFFMGFVVVLWIYFQKK